MPLYEFRCAQGHLTEEWWHLHSESRHEITCSICQQPAYKVVSMPVFHSAEFDKRTGLKIFKGDPFENTPLEGSDGVNPLHFDRDIKTGKREKKIFMKVS